MEEEGQKRRRAVKLDSEDRGDDEVALLTSLSRFSVSSVILLTSTALSCSNTSRCSAKCSDSETAPSRSA